MLCLGKGGERGKEYNGSPCSRSVILERGVKIVTKRATMLEQIPSSEHLAKDHPAPKEREAESPASASVTEAQFSVNEKVLLRKLDLRLLPPLTLLYLLSFLDRSNGQPLMCLLLLLLHISLMVSSRKCETGWVGHRSQNDRGSVFDRSYSLLHWLRHVRSPCKHCSEENQPPIMASDNRDCLGCGRDSTGCRTELDWLSHFAVFPRCSRGWSFPRCCLLSIHVV
jgi:hypothetical protein